MTSALCSCFPQNRGMAKLFESSPAGTLAWFDDRA